MGQRDPSVPQEIQWQRPKSQMAGLYQSLERSIRQIACRAATAIREGLLQTSQSSQSQFCYQKRNEELLRVLTGCYTHDSSCIMTKIINLLGRADLFVLWFLLVLESPSTDRQSRLYHGLVKFRKIRFAHPNYSYIVIVYQS